VGRRALRASAEPILVELAEVVGVEQSEPQEFIVQGNKVVALIFERFRIKATGRAVDNEYVHVSALSEGQIVHFCVLRHCI
jgi:uncharacterized protein